MIINHLLIWIKCFLKMQTADCRWLCSCVQRVVRYNPACIKDKSTHQNNHIKLQLNQYTLWNMKVKHVVYVFRLLLKSFSTAIRTWRIFWFSTSFVQQTWKYLSHHLQRSRTDLLLCSPSSCPWWGLYFISSHNSVVLFRHIDNLPSIQLLFSLGL